MYINDPHEKALLPETYSEIFEEEPRDYHEFFWDDQQTGPVKYISNEHGLHTQVCRFDENGDHISMARNCPHFDAEDETGRKIIPGWTVQSR